MSVHTDLSAAAALSSAHRAEQPARVLHLAILHDAGFDAAEATQAFRLLFTYTFGFAGLSPEQTATDAQRQAAAAIAALPPEAYPNLTRAAPHASKAMAGQEQFEYGLERILDGLEGRLANRRAPAKSRPGRRRTRQPLKPTG
jgi:hypothetical protein